MQEIAHNSFQWKRRIAIAGAAAALFLTASCDAYRGKADADTECTALASSDSSDVENWPKTNDYTTDLLSRTASQVTVTDGDGIQQLYGCTVELLPNGTFSGYNAQYIGRAPTQSAG